MNAPRRKQPSRRRHGRPSKPVDIWRPAPPLPVPDPITPAAEPGALLRSLGDPPLQGQGAVAGHYLEAVVERASMLAAALAATAGLLGEPDDAIEERSSLDR
ncbi:MAG TPA: hypothetical protein VGQ20_02630 [Acidimicrobiales bacterium]|nr:hypothetical protein [Acidimicrobiales bacterium]